MTLDLETQIMIAVESDGLEDLQVRVAGYEQDMRTPCRWQAIAKYRGRAKGPWGVGVAGTPEMAIRTALINGSEVRAEPPPATAESLGVFD